MKAKKSLVILDSSIQFDEFKKFSTENTTFVAADYETHKKLADSNTKHELLDNYLQKKERLELYDFVLSKYTWYENLSRKSDFEFNSINILSLMSSLEFHEFVLTVLIKLFSIKNIISNKSPNEIFVSTKFLKYVKLVQDKNKIHIFIRDQGPGIPEYARDEIYNRHYSLIRPSGEKSSGMGLAFAKQVIALHNGEIQLEPSSQEMNGANFRVSFPKH